MHSAMHDMQPESNLKFGRVAANIAIMPGFGWSDGGSQNLEEAFGVGLAALHGARVAPSFASFGVDFDGHDARDTDTGRAILDASNAIVYTFK